MQGRKHSLHSLSWLPYKQGQTHLSTAGEARSSRPLTRVAGSVIHCNNGNKSRRKFSFECYNVYVYEVDKMEIFGGNTEWNLLHLTK